LGDPGDDLCAGNSLNGTVTLSSNHGGLELSHNRIGNNTSVTGTTGTGPFAPTDDNQAEIEANTITGNLACSGNSPPATKDNLANGVSGNRSGECAGL
jgi:hypothetical protein